jgi:polyisoprenoid-binding protein YceI
MDHARRIAGTWVGEAGGTRCFCACGAVLLSASAWAGAAADLAPRRPPQLVAAQSEIGFVSHQMGVPIAGRFRNFDAQVRFDPLAPEKGHFLVGVDLSSVELPTADAMQEVVKPNWFDAQHFPRAVFESTSVRAAKPGQYEVSGQLNIKGHSQNVVVPVHLERSGALTLASGSLTVQRLAFAIGEGEWNDTSLVADEVQINFRLALSGVPAI